MPDPMPEATTQQVQHTQDEDEQEIDVVGVDEVETNNTETTANVADTRSKETTTNTELPVLMDHPHNKVRDKIDLPVVSADPPSMHQHFKLKTVPLKMVKTKLKRIELKKLQSLNEVKGYNYSLLTSPPNNRPIRIQSVLGGYNEHHEAKGGQVTAVSREYIEEINNIPLEEKHKTEISDSDKDEK